jgi:hypothetical protein
MTTAINEENIMSDTLNQTTVTAPAPTTTADDPKKTPDGSCCTVPPGGDPGPTT